MVFNCSALKQHFRLWDWKNNFIKLEGTHVDIAQEVLIKEWPVLWISWEASKIFQQSYSQCRRKLSNYLYIIDSLDLMCFHLYHLVGHLKNNVLKIPQIGTQGYPLAVIFFFLRYREITYRVGDYFTLQSRWSSRKYLLDAFQNKIFLKICFAFMS